MDKDVVILSEPGISLRKEGIERNYAWEDGQIEVKRHWC